MFLSLICSRALSPLHPSSFSAKHARHRWNHISTRKFKIYVALCPHKQESLASNLTVQPPREPHNSSSACWSLLNPLHLLRDGLKKSERLLSHLKSMQVSLRYEPLLRSRNPIHCTLPIMNEAALASNNSQFQHAWANEVNIRFIPSGRRSQSQAQACQPA